MKVHLDLHDRWVLLQGAWHGKTGPPVAVMHKFIDLWYHLMHEDERAKLLGWARRMLELDPPHSISGRCQCLFIARYSPYTQFVAEREGHRLRCFHMDGYRTDHAITIPPDGVIAFTPFDITTAPDRYTDAVRLVHDTRKAELQHLQRHLKVNTAQAMRIREHMVLEGLVRIDATGHAYLNFRSY